MHDSRVTKTCRRLLLLRACSSLIAASRSMAHPYTHADAVAGTQRRSRLRDIVIGALETKAPEHDGERDGRLHVREVHSNADARTRAKWQVRIAVPLGLHFGQEAIGVE